MKSFGFERWNLSKKILAASAIVTVVVGLVLTWQANHRIGELAESQLLDLGQEAGAKLGSQAEQAVMLGNTSGLTEALAGLKDNSAVLFAVVTDAKGQVLASTFAGGPPQDLAQQLAGPAGERGKVYDFQGHGYLRMEVPLMAGSLGQIHLGLDEGYVSSVVGKQTRQAFLTLAIVLALGLGLLAWVLEQLVKPIRELSEVTRRIVADGDLTQQVKVTSQDEVGDLAAHFVALVERLRQIPRDLDQNLQLLKQAVAALEDATAKQNSVVNRQATALQETQITAEEIKQTSQVAARSAEGILADIAKAEAAGEKGSAALEQSLESMGDILASARSTSTTIGVLGERTRQIGGITNTVKDLADQSNMLALNAAIEAVRSGEHGKGFALVAREIRRLADQSIQSTERVREILESVAGAVSTAVAGSEQGALRVESSLQQMRASGEHLRSLATVVRDTSLAVRQIVTAVGQQNTGVTQVFSAVVDQNTMMEESLRQLEGTLKAVGTLKEVSGGLAEVLGKYKI